jgi:hypothetical protein
MPHNIVFMGFHFLIEKREPTFPVLRLFVLTAEFPYSICKHIIDIVRTKKHRQAVLSVLISRTAD